MKTLQLFLLFFFTAQISFAQTPVKISALPTATGTGAGSDMPIVQGGVTKKIKPDSLIKPAIKRIDSINNVLTTALSTKQGTLTPGSNITIVGSTISATGVGNNLLLATNFIKALNDSTIYFDSSLVVTNVEGLNDSTIRVTFGNGVTSNITIKGGANTGGGGGGSPAGSTNYVQYNNAGAFGADVSLRFNPTGFTQNNVKKGLLSSPTITATSAGDTIVGLDVKTIVNRAAITNVNSVGARIENSDSVNKATLELINNYEGNSNVGAILDFKNRNYPLPITRLKSFIGASLLNHRFAIEVAGVPSAIFYPNKTVSIGLSNVAPSDDAPTIPLTIVGGGNTTTIGFSLYNSLGLFSSIEAKNDVGGGNSLRFKNTVGGSNDIENFRLEGENGNVIFQHGGTFTNIPSAIVQMNSTTQGFLPPRMTAANASLIATPAEGLLLYVTTTNGTFTSKGWWGWSGAAWEKLNN